MSISAQTKTPLIAMFVVNDSTLSPELGKSRVLNNGEMFVPLGVVEATGTCEITVLADVVSSFFIYIFAELETTLPTTVFCLAALLSVPDSSLVEVDTLYVTVPDVCQLKTKYTTINLSLFDGLNNSNFERLPTDAGTEIPCATKHLCFKRAVDKYALPATTVVGIGLVPLAGLGSPFLSSKPTTVLIKGF